MNETTIQSEKNNNKVPIAVLSFFLIAFILQGILKISGVFIFEKALNWDIFRIIDSNYWLRINYYSIINLINVYCLSFTLNTRCYTKKHWLSAIIVVGTYIVTICRLTLKTPFYMEYVYDVLLYIYIPSIVSILSEKQTKMFDNNFVGIINIITIHIMLYFCYLGIGYWSGLTSSIIVANQVIVYASSMFLIQLERYIGVVLLMLSLNIFNKNIKRRN